MPELNPRRVNSTKSRFAQVSAAVLAGMAAMFCLQNVIEFRREAALPVAPAPVALPESPAEPAPVVSMPDGVRRQAEPAASSMLLQPESGLSEGEVSVVGVSGEEAPPKFTLKDLPAPSKAAAKKKELPRLKDRSMDSRFASRAASTSGRFTEFHRPAPKAEEYVPPAPEAPAPKPALLAGSSGIKMLTKASPAPEHLQPALIAQMTVPERVFWTKARKFNITAAVLIMLFGIIYVIYASGIRNDPPAKAEGEL